jgi:glycosyltransferase involved in cell wall biosynthesis
MAGEDRGDALSASMRILHVGKYFPPVSGGMERFLGDLVKAQRAAGDDVSAIVHSDGRSTPDDPPWLMRCPVWFRLLFTPISPAFPLWLRRAISRHDPQVLHLHMPNASAFWALVLPSARRRPWVVHWHSDVEPSRFKIGLRMAYPFYRVFERAVLERAERIIASSARYLEASEPLHSWRYKCHVVPLGVDPDRLPEVATGRASHHWQTDGLRLLSIGRLTYYKGFDTLVRAVAGTPGMELVIAGEGEERPNLERVLAQGVAPARVRLAGEVDDATLRELLASCDLFCLSSRERTEAFGVVLLEAMRYGKPLLVSDLAGSGVTWVAKEGVNGVLAAPEDVDAWRAALASLSSDPARLRLLGERGRNRYLREFDIGQVARRIREIYSLALAVEREGDEAHGGAAAAGAPKAPRRDYLIVIPALNEAASIADVITRARAHGGADLVVVDDGSTDATRAIAVASGATVLRAPLWQGAWGAIQTGLRYAARHGYAGVVTMDADGQHEPEYLPQLLEAGRDADVVIAACPSRGSMLRHLAWRYFRFLTGFDIEDLTSGFRYYTAKACRLLAGPEATLLDYQDIGVLLLLRHANLRVAEVAVPMNPRRSGISRVFSSWWTVGVYMAETSLLCLARWNRLPRKAS